MLSLLTAMPASRIQEVTCSWACRIAAEAKGLVRRSGSSLQPPSTSQRSIAVAASRPTSDGFESDVLRAFPQDELADLAREDSRPVREQDLGLAEPAWVKQELAWRRVARVVLVAEIQGELAERNPGGLAAPTRLDDPRLEGEHPGEPGACFGCALSLEPCLE